MAFIIILLLVFISTTATAQNNQDNCLATIATEYGCTRYISSNCNNASFTVDKPVNESCTKSELFWSYPKDSLAVTFVIPSKFQYNKSRAYQFCLEKGNNQCAQAYYLNGDGTRTQVKWDTDAPACFKSQKESKSIKFRFQAGDQWICYGHAIRYSFKN